MGNNLLLSLDLDVPFEDVVGFSVVLMFTEFSFIVLSVVFTYYLFIYLFVILVVKF